MGALPQNNRIYEIKHLHERSKEILRRLTLGQKAKEIAEDLGITRAVVTYTQNSELGREKLDELQGGRDESVKNITSHITDLQPRAIEVLEQALNGSIGGRIDGSNVTIPTQIKVAQDLLGRGGYVPPMRVQQHHLHEHKLTADDITEIKAQAYKLGKHNGHIVETEAKVLEPGRTEDKNAENTDTTRDA